MKLKNQYRCLLITLVITLLFSVIPTKPAYASVKSKALTFTDFMLEQKSVTYKRIKYTWLFIVDVAVSSDATRGKFLQDYWDDLDSNTKHDIMQTLVMNKDIRGLKPADADIYADMAINGTKTQKALVKRIVKSLNPRIVYQSNFNNNAGVIYATGKKLYKSGRHVILAYFKAK